MVNSKRVIFSFLEIRAVESMTKEDAQKIVDKMDPSKVEKIKKWIQKWFKKPMMKEASFFDIVKKINKVTGLPLIEIAAVGVLFFGGLSPSYGDIHKEETRTEQRSISEIRREIEKKLELPDKLENLVEKTNQGLINIMGLKGFIGTVKRNIKNSLTPEISELLVQIPENQWPELLASVVMQKIKADPEVSVKYDAFVKHLKTNDAAMVKEIEKVVQSEKSKIKNHVEQVMVKKAFEKGYLIL